MNSKEHEAKIQDRVVNPLVKSVHICVDILGTDHTINLLATTP